MSGMNLQEPDTRPPMPIPPLMYDDTCPVTAVQRVLFVHSAASSLQTYANGTTFSIVYNDLSTLEELLALTRRKFPSKSLPRVGFAFHNNGERTRFLDNEAWFSDSDLDVSQTTFSKNAQFLLDFIREFSVKNVDFLACKTLENTKWRRYFGLLQAQTNVVVGASDNDTGNMKFGGDWIMESTMEDVRDVYFSAAIVNWASLLVATMTVVANVGRFSIGVTIDGDILYTSKNNTIQKINLLTNTVINAAWYTGPNNIYHMCTYGGYLYFTNNLVTVGKVGRINISNGVVDPNWVTGMDYPFGIATDGTYLYITTCNANSGARINRVLLTYTGPAPTTPWIPAKAASGLNYPSKIYILGNFIYVANFGGGYASKFNLSDGSLVTAQFVYVNYQTSIFGDGNFLYIGVDINDSPVPAHGIVQVRLDGTIADPVYFSNAQTTSGYWSTYTYVDDMAIYNNKLYCTTMAYGYVFSIPLPVTTVAPYISAVPTVSASITYPATIGSATLSGGSALTLAGGTAVPGIFTISSTISSSVYNAGTYTNVLATFNPTDTSAYSSVSTSVPSITVLKATPFLAARPVSATLISPNKLSALVITGGSCLVTSGGASLPGTFSIHPDLSNSIFAVGTYQDVSAIFTPTAGTNYNSVMTTIQTVTITKATTVQLQSLGIPAAELRTGGYTASELKNANFTTAQLKTAMFTPTEMKSAGITTAELYAVFTTLTETKSVTKAVVVDLLVSAPKTSVSLSTLAGYTFQTFVTSAVAVKVSDVSIPIIVSRSEMDKGKKAIYAVLDVSGSYIVLPTYSSSIRVMNIGTEKYRVYNSTGTTIIQDNLMTGATVAIDGLTVVIGSVTATMTPPPTVNFVLNALNSSIQLSTSSVIPNYSPSFTADATITLNTSVPASVFQETFFFRTDTDITTDASFVYYYVDTTKWPNKNTTLSARNGIVTSNGYVSNDTGGKDFLRDLARQLFGTYLGADLFTNEDAVVADINTKFDTVATNIVSLLDSIDKTSGTFGGMATDLSGNKYLKDDTSTSNISRELMNELMTAAPARFVDIKTNYKYNGAVEDGFYKMPILAGDTITFKVTISPSTTQTTAVPTGPTALTSRSYTVILNVV